MNLKPPAFPLFDACSFLAVSAVKWPGGHTTFASGIAASYLDIPAALERALFGTIVPSPEELEPIAVFVENVGNPDLWIRSEITDAPLFAEATFNYDNDGDGDNPTAPELTLRLLALVDIVPAKVAPNEAPTPLSLEEHTQILTALDESRRARAASFNNVPFHGNCEPGTFAEIVDAILNSDRGEIVRMSMEGEFEDFGVAYAGPANTNPEDEIAVEVIYDCHPDDTDFVAEILSLYSGFNEVNARRAAGLLFVSTIGKKEAVQSVLDWSSEKFVSIRTHPHITAV